MWIFSYILLVIGVKIRNFIKRGGSFFALSVCALLCAAAAVFSRGCARGISQGIELALGQLIPSMFFIAVIADFAVRAGALNAGGKILERAAETLFGVSKCGLWIILLSLVGGYPVGARMIVSALAQRGVSRKEAESLSYVCVCAGPGFLISFVGEALLQSKAAGAALFASQAASVLILAAAAGLTLRKSGTKDLPPRGCARSGLGQALISAVNSGALTCLSASAAVAAFSGLLGIIDAAAEGRTPEILSTALTALCEVTSACKLLARSAPLPVLGFAVGFGGLCVHFQIFSILSGIRISKLKFLLLRLVQGAITALFAFLCAPALGGTREVFAALSRPPAAASAATAVGSAALVLTSALFILTLRREKLCAE